MTSGSTVKCHRVPLQLLMLLESCAGSLALAEESLTQGRVCGTGLSWNNYVIKEHGNVQDQ